MSAADGLPRVFLTDEERAALVHYPMRRGQVARVTPINGTEMLRCAIHDQRTGGWIRLRELPASLINRTKLDMVAAYYNHHARRAVNAG